MRSRASTVGREDQVMPVTGHFLPVGQVRLSSLDVPITSLQALYESMPGLGLGPGIGFTLVKLIGQSL